MTHHRLFTFLSAGVFALAAASVVAISLRAQPGLESTRPAEPGAAQPAAKAPAGVRRFGLAEPLPRTKGAIRLTTYNLENLFDDKDDPALSGEVDDAKMTKPPAHCQAAADAIRRINPDILALQEVESYDALIWFRDTYLAGLGYDHVVSIDSGDPRGIECSVLSRFPLSDPKVWRDLPLGGTHPAMEGDRPNPNAGKPIAFKRSPLRVTVEVAADRVASLLREAGQDEQAKGAKPYRLTLFVVHLKASRDMGYWREREAAKTVELVRDVVAADKDANVIVLGDCNAQYTERPVQIMLEGGLSEIFKNRSSRDAATTTHASARKIDQVLVNPNAEAEIIPQSRFVLGTLDRPQGVDWRTTPAPAGYASDHYPVVVDIRPVEQPTAAKADSPKKPVDSTLPAAPARPG